MLKMKMKIKIKIKIKMKMNMNNSAFRGAPEGLFIVDNPPTSV